MAEQVKPRKKKPGYLKGNPELATIRAASGKKVHPDIFAPTMDYKYFVAFLRAHPKHPKNEEGKPSPFVSILKYPGGRFGYKLPDNDSRYGPIASKELIEAGKDPLYRRHIRLNKSEDQEESSMGWGLRPRPRVEINVIVLKIKDEKGKTLKSGENVGELHKRAHILSIPGDTWSKQVQPLFEEEDHESDDVLYYDLFGEETAVVPVMTVELLKKGAKSGQIEWKFGRTNSSVKFKKSWIKSLINIKEHPTNTPHTEEELNKILGMTGAREADEADEDDMDFSNKSDEYDSLDEDEVEDVPDDEDLDEDEEEEKPKKKKKKTSKKKTDKKKKSKKKDDDEDLEDEDDEEEEEKPKKKKRGRPKKTKDEYEEDDDDLDFDEDEDEDDDDGDDIDLDDEEDDE